MSNEILGLINLTEDHDNFEELTYFRSPAALPFMGRYRIIDFKISNFWYSGVNVIGVFANAKFRSLLDHLNREEDFGMEGRASRIFVLPPDFNDPTDISKGDLKYFHNHIDLFTRSSSEHVVISDMSFISNQDFKDAFKHHKIKDNDVTFVINEYQEDHIPEGPMLRVNLDGDRVVGMNHDQNNNRVYSGVYIIKKSVLLDTINYCISNYKESFFHNGIRERLDELNVGHFNLESQGYYFHSIQSYFQNSMKLLSKDAYRNFLYGKNRVMTKISKRPPTLFKANSEVKNSVLSNGVVIRGTIENSILSRNVIIEEGAVVKNAVIFANSVVKKDAHLENVIIDKDVVISEGRHVIGTENIPFIAAKRTNI